MHSAFNPVCRAAVALLWVGVWLSVGVVPAFGQTAPRSAAREVKANALPAGAVARCGESPFAPAGRRVAWSTTGLLASAALGHDPRSVRIWDGRTAQHVADWDTGFAVADIQFSADGKRLAAGGLSESVSLWDTVAQKPLPSIGRLTAPTLAVALAPDRPWLAVSLEDGSVRIWDLESNTERKVLRGHVGGAGALVFIPGGVLAAADRSDGQVRVWDVERGEQKYALEIGGKKPISIAVSPDGKQLLTIGTQQVLRRWNASDGQSLGEELRCSWPEAGPQAPPPKAARQPAGLGLGALLIPSPLAFSRDGSLLFVAHRLYDTKTWKELGSIQGMGPSHAFAFSPDQTQLATTTDGALRVWSVPELTERWPRSGHAHGVDACVFLGSGGLMSFSQREKLVREWNPLTGAAQGKWEFEGDDLIAGTEGEALLLDPTKIAIRLRNPKREQTRALLAAWTDQPPKVWSRAIAADLSRWATSLDRNVVEVWQSDTGKLARRITGPAGDVVPAMALSANGSHLAGHWQDDEQVRIWKVDSGESVATFERRGDSDVLAFSPNQQFLASGSAGEILVWDLNAKRQLHRLPHASKRAPLVVFCPNSKLLATSDGEQVVVFDAPSGKELKRFKGHAATVTALAFSRDGRLLASGSLDSTLVVWKAPE